MSHLVFLSSNEADAEFLAGLRRHLNTVGARGLVSWHPDDAEWYDEWQKGRIGAACMGIYTRGGTVFTAATTDWAHGLKGNDPSVIQITKNIIERLSKR